MIKQALGTIALLLWAVTASAQIYPTQHRPPGINWRQLNTPHFMIVYPAGEDSAAWSTGRILESQYGGIQKLTGGALKNFPVILNNYNDRSNGFVTPLHFRSEIELPPIKGKTLNPRSGNWLEAVAPHELVHALHLSNTGGNGVGALINLFSPDMARALHGAIPAGITEGLAVQYETTSGLRGGGRGSYSYFTNRFDAVFNSPSSWSMGQMIHFPSQTRPFNRHYIGGFEFTSWLQETYGNTTSRDALAFYIDMPFLGYGIALKHATGKWPSQLYDAFSNHKQTVLEDKNTEFSKPRALNIPLRGAEVRSPKWLDNSTLVFYGSFYNSRPGFYSYHLPKEEIQIIAPTNTVEDYKYDLSADRSKLVFSYYRSSPLYSNTYKAELVEMEVETGLMKPLSTDGRLYAPSYHQEGLLALQTDHASSRLVAYDTEERTSNPVANPENHQIIEVAVNPIHPGQVAVIINKRGVQSLWIAPLNNLEHTLKQPPNISFENASVFDAEWHPEGEKLLFTADLDDRMNIYEYNIRKEQVLQVTNSRYNAFEGAYSPTGKHIAFVFQKGNLLLPSVLDLGDADGSLLDPALWKFSELKKQLMQRPELGSYIDVQNEDWESTDYSGGYSWLRPRALFPVIEEVSNRNIYKTGVELQSNNLLQSQSYALEATMLQRKPWFNLTYQNKNFYPGFRIGAFRSPSYRTIRARLQTGTLQQAYLLENRGLSLAIPATIALNRNVFSSSLTLEPEIRLSQLHYFNLDGTSASGFADFAIAGIYTSYSHRLQQNIRDMQPNAGIFIYAQLQHYLNSGNLVLGSRAGDIRLDYDQPTGFRAGIYGFVSPNRTWNQSLRIGLQTVHQNGLVFDNQGMISNGFSSPVFASSNQLASLDLRYTIPLLYPDNGGFLLPFYLSSIYLVGFSDSVVSYEKNRLPGASRTVLGGGIRMQFRLSNLSFELGIGLGYEPSRGKTNIFVGDF